MSQIIYLARECGRLEERIARQDERIRDLVVANSMLTHEIADSVGPKMEPPS